MDKDTLPVDDNRAPQSSKIIEISSIYIDLKFPKEKNPSESCQYDVSNSGKASERRKTNPKASISCASNASLDNKIEEQLPAIGIPKLRWWRCAKCRRMNKYYTAEETVVHPTCCSYSTSSNVPSHDDTNLIRSATQPISPAHRSNQKTNYAITEVVAAAAGDGNVGSDGDVIDLASPTIDEEASAKIGNAKNIHEYSSGVQHVLCKKRKFRYLDELMADKSNLGYSIHSSVVRQGRPPNEDIGPKRKMPSQGTVDLSTETLNETCTSEAQADASSERDPVPLILNNKQIEVHDRFSPAPGEQSSNENSTKGCDLQVGLELSLNSFMTMNVSSSENKENSSSSEIYDLHLGQRSIVSDPKPDMKKSLDWDLNERITDNPDDLTESINPFQTKETRYHKEKIFEFDGRSLEVNEQGDNGISWLSMAGNFLNNSQSTDGIFDIFSRGMLFSASASQRAKMLPSSSSPNMPFELDIHQNYPTQNLESLHKGKPINDIKADEMRKVQEGGFQK